MGSRYTFGVMLALAGGLCLSTAGVLLRHIESADGWQILFFRAVGFCITIFLVVLYRNGRNTARVFVAVGGRGVVAAIVLGLGSVAYIYAILLTSVANAVFIIGTSPLWTALLAWIFLKERASTLSLIAMFLALAGIGLMFQDGINSGSLTGAIIALGVALSYAVYLLIVREAKGIDMSPVISICGLFTALLAYFMADSLTIPTGDLAIAIFLGVVQFSGGFLLLTISARYIPAGEVALFSLSEAILAPTWVWLVVNETPSDLTLIGAVIVSVAVVGYSLISILSARRENNGN
ncbi:MAG: DME family drug/metabolite transporter [Parasphingorhabdus sp.]|jgi:DME family drug/metabolite transporter